MYVTAATGRQPNCGKQINNNNNNNNIVATKLETVHRLGHTAGVPCTISQQILTLKFLSV